MQITIKFMKWAKKPAFTGDTANLQGADLRNVNLYAANLQGAKNAELPYARTLIVPEHGAFVGWKKCRDDVLVQVQIPANAQRSNATGRKCRASHVKVLKIEGGHKSATSQHDNKTKYVVGKVVKCDKWCADRWQECAGGIHFSSLALKRRITKMSDNSLVMVVRVHFNRPLGPYVAGKALRNVLDQLDLQAQPALESRGFDTPADIYIEKLEIVT